MIQSIFFGMFAGITVFSALAVALQKNLIRAVFYLLATFMGIAALYVMLDADFLAVSQILIYVGGILTLFLFGVLISNKNGKKYLESGIHFRKRAFFVSLVLGCILIYLIFKEKGSFSSVNIVASSSHTIGIGILSKYIVPFELTGVLLLAVLIGILSLASHIKAK